MGDRWEPISRRTVLRGLGVTMCLPLLEAMAPLVARADAEGGRNGGDRPRRLAVLYMPNGVHPKEWRPEGVGADFALSPVLAPLASLRSELLVLTHLSNRPTFGGDGHYAKVSPFLTGVAITKTTGSDLHCGVSMDQIIAQRIGNLTPLPSLELSVEPVTMGVDTNVGFTRLYGSHISWSSPTTPVTREINPQLAFDRLFRSGRGAGAAAGGENDASILDAVREDARRLEKRVGKADRLKLSEYFDSVRAVEKRIAYDAARRRGEYHADPLALKEVEKLGGRIRDYYTDPARLSERAIDHTGQVQILMDLIALAFWTDSTRVATFMFGNEVSGKNFSFLPGVGGSHHEISHHENKPEKLEQYRKINVWHVEQYAYLLNRLRSIREGDSTLLDASMVLFGSGMHDGNAHDPHDLPLLLAGRGGGTLATGRHLVYGKDTPFSNLHRALLARMGADVPGFGDSTGVLPGLDDPAYKGVATA
jgi:hypothetical protein